jgi:hypothetical protein
LSRVVRRALRRCLDEPPLLSGREFRELQRARAWLDALTEKSERDALKRKAKAMKSLAVVILLALALPAHADNLVFSGSVESEGSAQAESNVYVGNIPSGHAVTFAQVTIDYDSTEIEFNSVEVQSGIDMSLLATYRNNFTPEQGNTTLTMQFARDAGTSGMVADDYLCSIIWDKVSCGSATCHLNESGMSNPPNHANTDEPVQYSHYFENLTTNDGYVTFTCTHCPPDCGGLDKPLPDNQWGNVKALYR